MCSRRSLNKENKDRLSLFGQRLQSLSDSFYSTILEDSKEKKFPIKTVKQLEDLERSESNDFTFDECSNSQIKSNDEFSFTFNSSIDQTKIQKHQIKRINHSSTPYSIREENFIRKREDETIVVEDTRPPQQPIIVGYYPVISYQPVCLPPTIYLSNQQIQSQTKSHSKLIKKN